MYAIRSYYDDADNGTSFVYSKDGEPGPVSKNLYQKLRAIQYGDDVDPYGWITIRNNFV